MALSCFGEADLVFFCCTLGKPGNPLFGGCHPICQGDGRVGGRQSPLGRVIHNVPAFSARDDQRERAVFLQFHDLPHRLERDGA